MHYLLKLIVKMHNFGLPDNRRNYAEILGPFQTPNTALASSIEFKASMPSVEGKRVDIHWNKMF